MTGLYRALIAVTCVVLLCTSAFVVYVVMEDRAERRQQAVLQASLQATQVAYAERLDKAFVAGFADGSAGQWLPQNMPTSAPIVIPQVTPARVEIYADPMPLPTVQPIPIPTFTQSDAPPTVTPAPGNVATYRAYSADGPIRVEYNAEGNALTQQQDINEPWSIEIPMSRQQWYHLEAQSQLPTGAVMCEILFNGEIIVHEQAGDGQPAVCTLPASD